MEAIKNKLEEYGLSARQNPDISGNADYIAKCQGDNGDELLNFILNVLFEVTIEQPKKFEKKIRVPEQKRGMPKDCYQTVKLAINGKKLFFVPKVSYKAIVEIIHRDITKNEGAYESKYPEYALKRIFNKQEIEVLKEKVADEFWEYYIEEGYPDGMEKLYSELLKVYKKIKKNDVQSNRIDSGTEKVTKE